VKGSTKGTIDEKKGHESKNKTMEKIDGRNVEGSFYTTVTK